MPDDSKGVRTLADAMRSWAEVELRKAYAAGIEPFATTARSELVRRGLCPCAACGDEGSP